jgi:hypothetical protein
LGYKGFLEGFTENILRGWAVSEDGQPCLCDVFIDDEHVLSVRSLRKRPDLEAAGHARSGGGFAVNLSANLPSGPAMISARFPDGSTIAGGPFTQSSQLASLPTVNQHLAWRSVERAQRRLRIIGDIDFATNLNTASALSKIIAYENIEVVTELSAPADACILFDTSMTISLPENHRGGIINGRGFNSDKAHLERAHREAFGYGLSIDPERHHGPIVVKSRRNATHDGRVVHGPTAVGDDCVAQIPVDNVLGNSVQDIRVPIIRGTIPFVYLKYRPLMYRFDNVNSSAVMAGTDEAFSRKEILHIISLCKMLCLDYGELDVLRDRTTGLLYVVDANNTPSGPPQGIAPAEAAAAIRLLSASFCAAFFPKSH